MGSLFSPALAVFALAVILVPPAFGADAKAAPSGLKEAVRQLLRENPDIVLEVLRDNSVTVLEIAQQGAQTQQHQAMLAQWKHDLTLSKTVDMNRPVRGNAGAPVAIVAYSDYTCPYCSQTAQTVDQLLASRKDDVYFLFKHFPLKGHAQARLASEYAAAAFILDEAKGWEFHDALFANQERLAKEGEGFLRATALAVGLNLQKLASEAKGRKVKAIIDEDMAEGAALGVKGTPYHLVNKLGIRGAVPFRYFAEALDIALKNKDSALTDGRSAVSE